MEEKRSIAPIINTIIGLVIMFSGYFLPCPGMVVEPMEKLASLNLPVVDGGVYLSITRIGMIISMTFFGIVYLWTFVDTFWPCFVGVFAMAISGFAPPPKVLSMFLGNPMVVMIFFLMMVAAAIVYSNLASWVAHFAMTRKFVNGRPWVLTATMLFTTYVVAFLDQVSAMFLMWPAMFAVFKDTGFKKGDLYVSLMTVYIGIVILLSFASDPFKGGAMYLVMNLQSLAGTEVAANVPTLNLATYVLLSVIVSVIIISCLLLLMRFVFRVDLSHLKDYAGVAGEKPLEPMTAMQKLVLFDFLFYVCWLILPSIIGADNVVGAFLKKNQLTASIVAAGILSIVFVKGKPLVNLIAANARYPWVTFLLIAVAMLLGGAMTGPGTNVSLYMEFALRKLLGGMNPILFTIAVATIGIVFTNFCNSVVLGLMLTPVLLAVATAFNVNPAPMMYCFIYAVLVAACTPAASPFAAQLYANTEWISPRNIAVHAVIASLVTLAVVILVGMPLANIFF